MHYACTSTTIVNMPVNISIRAVPDAVRDELAARAARSGQSLQEYLLSELTALASRPSAVEAIARIRSHAVHYPPLDVTGVLDDLNAERR
jgi:antitoxin FitA